MEILNVSFSCFRRIVESIAVNYLVGSYNLLRNKQTKPIKRLLGNSKGKELNSQLQACVLVSPLGGSVYL